MIEEKALRSLEFGKILEKLATFATSVPARERIRSLRPFSDAETIETRLAETAEADRILYEYALTLSFGFDDVSAILEKAKVMSVLTMGEILKVGRILRVSRALKTNIKKVPDDGIFLLKEKAERLYDDISLEDKIDKAILSDTEMNDNASPVLRSVRQKIKRTGESIKTKLYQYVSSSSYSKYIQDNIVTVRGDRYVIPVKAEYKSAISGLIHDQSASGQTFYIEPIEIVEMNNTLKTYLLEEAQEIERILREFTLKISITAEGIALGFDTMTELDMIFAKAYYAHHIRAQRPVINTEGRVKISRGRHPLLGEGRVVPVDIRLGDPFSMLLITGPNTGGKTVSLKLVGLFEVMAMSGLFLPCVEAEIAVFEDIYCDIGDEQSIEQNLSTFSSHIANIVRIIENLTPKTLVLLDELGAGTDPTEGASLAVSISDYILKSGAKAMITTHYNELKEYAVVTEGVENASMDFDPVTYNPTYKLIVGTPGASNAILIAEKLGLKREIIQKAKEGIEKGKVEFENVLTALEIARRNAVQNEEETARLKTEAETLAESVRRERDRLYIQREKLNENVRKETKRLVEEAMEEANEIIESLRAVLDDPSEQNLFLARKLRKSLTKYVVQEENEFEGFGEEETGEISVGDRVLVKPLKVEGDVVELNHLKGTATVQLGRLKSNFRLGTLIRVRKKQGAMPKVKHTAPPLNNEVFVPEINLIGQTTAEARENLMRFLDKAILSGLHEVRIVHGYGTGKLRDMVRGVLREQPFIKEFRDGIYGEGERGVTIAKI